jgi:hypothetical protein
VITTYRWFQLRVQKAELLIARDLNVVAAETWRNKVRMVDFLIFNAIYLNEMWVLNQDQTFLLISLNEYQYGSRPYNIFNYTDPQKNKQKELNFNAKVPGNPIVKQFESCLNNFDPNLNYLNSYYQDSSIIGK